jgi:hypothetical protein
MATRFVYASKHKAWETAHDDFGTGQITFGSQKQSFPSQPGLFAQKMTNVQRFSDRRQD